jgi:hypothetical protein
MKINHEKNDWQQDTSFILDPRIYVWLNCWFSNKRMNSRKKSRLQLLEAINCKYHDQSITTVHHQQIQVYVPNQAKIEGDVIAFQLNASRFYQSRFQKP